MSDTPVVVAARRTPIGTAGHAYRELGVDRLAAPVIAAVAADVAADLPGRRVDDVVLGNCMGPGGNVARISALAAGLGDEVPGLTVDRQCGSGLENGRCCRRSTPSPGEPAPRGTNGPRERTQPATPAC
ncbi:hypothetical protein AB0J43_60325 [Nonomuraea fuscirosea]